MTGVHDRVMVLTLVAAVAGGCGLQAQSLAAVNGSFDRRLTVSGPVDLDVYSRSGHVHVNPGAGDTVRIAARIRAYGSFNWHGAYTAEEQVKALESAPPVEQRGSTITLGEIRDEALASGVTIDYEITVPSETRLRTSTRSGDQRIASIRGPVTATSRSGHILIEHVAGDLDVETRSGEITLADHSGAVKATSRSGRVSLDGQPRRPWDVGTRSGDVDVRLPADAAVELDVHTRSGSVDSNRPLQVRDVRSRQRVRGTVGNGGGRLAVSTRSGSVRIR